jgi:hypothetical protein
VPASNAWISSFSASGSFAASALAFSSSWRPAAPGVTDPRYACASAKFASSSMAFFMPAAPSVMRTLSSRSRASLKAATAAGDGDVIVTSAVLAEATEAESQWVASRVATRNEAFLMVITFPGAAREARAASSHRCGG